METGTEDFLDSFHQITGTTIGERRKNLFNLLNRTKQTVVNIDFESIEPKTTLEESFKIQTLLYFEKIPILIEVLKSENKKLIDKLINEKFLKHIFEYVTETQLVEDYFPHFSFNTKIKLINKLCSSIKDEERADVLFAEIEKKYGFYLATKLLPCCSGNLILECANSFKFELTPRQLLSIVKKHPHLTAEILKALSQYTDSKILGYKYKIVFAHILKNDLQLFLTMQKEYQCNLRIGWRSTKNIITHNKDTVAVKAAIFYKYLHAKQIAKSFTGDFSKFYLNMFPPSLSRFKENITYYVGLLEHLPRRVSKLNLLLSTFQEIYGSDLWNSGCVHKSVLELMSVNERESWMNSHSKPDYVSEEVWICLMKTEKSIPALKERMSSKSNVKERAELIGCLVETCRINNDDEALLNVCKYVLTHHRNDNSSVLLSFLSTLDVCYKLNNLNDAHWKCIIDLVNQLIVRNEVTYQHNDWLLAYINYLILKDQLTKEVFIALMKKVNAYSAAHSYMKEKRAQKAFLIIHGEVLPNVCKTDELKSRSVQFLEDVLRWNQQNPSDKVSLLPYQDFIDTMMEEVRNYSECQYFQTHVVLQLLHSDTSDQNKEEYLDGLFNKKNLYIDHDLLLWFVQYKPLIVDKYLDAITKMMLNLKPTLGCIRFWLFCCNYAHLSIPQRITDLCLDLLKNESLDKKNVMVALSCVMQSLGFIELIKPYYPSDLRMDVNADDQDLYKMQQGITISLKNVVPPSITFDSVLRFSKGDYMKFIQRTLHSISHNATENHLTTFFPSFKNHPVSVRKHAIYQTFKVLDKTAILSMLTDFKQNEKNSSILKIIFKGTFNYFVKNPNDHLFSLVKENLKSIDGSDEEAFQVLLNIKKIPLKYLAEYLVFSYDVFEKLPEGNAKVQDGKIQLLNSITPEVLIKVSREFSWGVVLNLFKESSNFGDALQTFSCRFLAYSVDDRVGDVFGIIKNFVISSWRNDTMKCVARKQINTFIHNLCLIFITDRNASKERLKSFVSLWNDFLKPHEAFHEYLEMYFSSRLLDGEDLIGSIFHLCDHLNEYDCVVAFDIAQILTVFLPYFFEDTDDLFELNRLDLIRALVTSTRAVCALIGVSLLPYSFPDNFKVVESYENVLQLLKNVKDPVVCLYLSSYLQKLSLEKSTSDENANVFERYKYRMYFVQCTNKYRQ